MSGAAAVLRGMAFGRAARVAPCVPVWVETRDERFHPTRGRRRDWPAGARLLRDLKALSPP